MAFFSKRKLSPIERFESALKDKHAAREKLTDRLRVAETALEEIRAAATRLAMAGATDAQLNWAEADMCAPPRTALRHCALHWHNSLEHRHNQTRISRRQNAARPRDSGERASEDGYGNRASCSKLRCSCGRACRDYHEKRGVNSGGRLGLQLIWMRSVARFFGSRIYLLKPRSTAARTRAGNVNFSVRANPEPECPLSRDRAPIDLHAQSVALAGGRRSAQGPGIRAG